jgi:hypothetical protein
MQQLRRLCVRPTERPSIPISVDHPMDKLTALLGTFTVLISCAMRVAASGTPAAESPTAGVLFEKIAALDSAVFDAFNHCDAPAQLQKHASYFAPDVEFYHDSGGVTWTRDAMIAKTRENVCGHFRRELIPGSLRVFPIKDFGAIEQGVHRFCQFETGTCNGMADFVVVWRQQGAAWQITRVLSYGHRAIDQPDR